MLKKDKFKRRWENIQSYIGWEDYLGGLLIVLGMLGYIPGPVPDVGMITKFYLESRVELIFIGLSILIASSVNDLYQLREEKRRLIIHMGSYDNTSAIDAIRQLKLRDWLTDGSIKKAVLVEANLTGADLRDADLSGANLTDADLRDADLSGANLTDADLSGAKLPDATLRNIKLNGANLLRAGMSNADLTGATVSEEQLSELMMLSLATMPDGTRYDGRFRLEGDYSLMIRWVLNRAGGPDDPSDKALFFHVSLEEYLAGQEWAEENLQRLRGEEE